jgi:hypothetical protein
MQKGYRSTSYKLNNLKKLKFSSYRNYIEDFNLIKNIKIIDTRSPSFY